MFENESFKSSLTSTVSMEAGRRGLASYETGIVDYLQKLASVNEVTLMEQEMRKVVGARRGINEALQSARELVKEGAKFAAADKRTTLTVADITAAYRVKFCSVWPFCK